MKNSISTATILMVLSISNAFAQDIQVPDKEHRQGMSYDEYVNVREKMRLRLESRAKENNQSDDAPAIVKERPDRERHYGQGYLSRHPQVDRMNRVERPERPERPDTPRMEKMERFGRP